MRGAPGRVGAPRPNNVLNLLVVEEVRLQNDNDCGRTVGLPFHSH